MTGSILPGAANQSSQMSLLVANAATARQSLDRLTRQAADGRIADTYAGLGAGAKTSLDLRPAIAHAKTAQSNIDSAFGRMDQTQTAMTRLQDIASSFYARLNNLNGLNASEVDSIAADARIALRQVAGLLNSRNGDVYVFAGSDTANPPVPNAENILTSGYYTQINTAVGGLSGAGAAATVAATLAVATSNIAGTSPFSASQSQSAAALQADVPTIDAGGGPRPQVGLLASANTNVVSTGTSTTGSATRDLMRALATIGSLSSSQIGVAGFAALVDDTRSGLNSSIGAMASDAGVLGQAQATLTTTRSSLGDVQTALNAQLSSAEDVDLAATLAALQLAQTRLQSSYQLIAGQSALSLTKYI
jgi:flagellar hook-associated protein 3 FlgL